jgi:flagellar assembly protein FliH
MPAANLTGVLPSVAPSAAAPSATARPATARALAAQAIDPVSVDLPAAATTAAPTTEASNHAATILASQQLADAELASAFAVAESRGFESGLARGEAAGREELERQAAHVAAIAAGLCEVKAAVFAEAHDTLIEIVHAAAAKILGDHILTRGGVVAAVECTMHSFRDENQLVVRLHPQDALLLRQAWGAAVKEPTMRATLREDPSIVLGGCIVDSARGSLDARLDIQLAALRETLLEVRRQSGGNGEPI